MGQLLGGGFYPLAVDNDPFKGGGVDNLWISCAYTWGYPGDNLVKWFLCDLCHMTSVLRPVDMWITLWIRSVDLYHPVDKPVDKPPYAVDNVVTSG